MNNYDQSSTGINIESYVFYDYSMARELFQENFEVVQSESYYKNTIAFYNPARIDIEFSLQGTPEQVRERLKQEGIQDDLSLGELFDELQSYYGERITLANYEDFNQVYAPLFVKPSKELKKIVTRGYSQGDYAEVFYCPDDVGGDIATIIHRLFWDAPIDALMTVNGIDYCYYDCPDYDPYKWNREKFLEYVSKESGVSVELLDKYLAKEPKS